MSSFLIASSRSIVPVEGQLQLDFNLELESGESVSNPVIAYQTWGMLNEARSNVVWVCHALTGNHRVHEWWDGLFGSEKCFDPNEYYIVSVNVLGSCYGTTGPLSFSEEEQPYFRQFPLVTIRDMVSVLDLVRVFLEIDQIQVLIGASLGGQQALEWAVQKPYLFQRIIPIATNVKHSPFGIAFNEAQRLAIEADSTYFNDEYFGGINGLIAARSIGMLSYRSYDGYETTQSESNSTKFDDFKAASYQRYQGEKLAKRFNAYSYWILSKAMDSHDLGRNRESIGDLLSKLRIPTLVVGIDSDMLFPITEQQFIATHIPQAQLVTLKSRYGHDGFLVEHQQLSAVISSFLEANFLHETVLKHNN